MLTEADCLDMLVAKLKPLKSKNTKSTMQARLSQIICVGGVR